MSVFSVEAGPSVSFSLEGVPPAWLNKRQHWAAKAAEMKLWRERSLYLAMAARVRAADEVMRVVPDKRAYPRRRRMEILMRRVRPLDRDNKWSAVKPIVDGIAQQLCVDDAEEWLDLQVDQVKVRHFREERTLIRVTDLGARE